MVNYKITIHELTKEQTSKVEDFLVNEFRAKKITYKKENEKLFWIVCIVLIILLMIIQPLFILLLEATK